MAKAKDLAKSDPDTLFITDNGRTVCGRHLGHTARFTGRDISGQRIMKVTPEVVAMDRQEYPDSPPMCCEACRFAAGQEAEQQLMASEVRAERTNDAWAEGFTA